MMKSRAERIAAITEKIAELTGKWTKLKNRISRLEQTLKTLLKHSETERDMRIPGQTDHRFRPKPITDSDSNRSLIPAETDHRFRSKPITLSRG